MKKLFAGTPHTKFIAAALAFIWMIAIVTSVRGVQLQAARVTQVVKDVKVLEKAAPRPVALGDLIRHSTPVSTGTQSRGELTFDDRTITRLGANTTFNFKPGTREMNLIDGAILFQVPKGSGGATIKTAGVTAAITGTTGIGEFHPATASHPHLFSKWLCLEGRIRLYLANGQSVELGSGQMVITDGESFSPILTFDIARLVSTSLFFTGFDRPLPSLDLIVLEEQKQLANMLFAPPTPNPLDPTRIVNVISQAIVAEEAQTSPSESPTPPITPTPPPPTPSEFGTPSVITSPVPYLITNGTIITTDPSITTNGVTDFGKIYRGPVDDGAFSLWAFGSTSAVDTALDFDTNFENAVDFPLAAFKFTSLEFTGNPTIDLTNGVANLALISVGDITSGLPGGTLTFSGLDALLLASQNGSINFGSEIAFQGVPTLFFYARGTNGDLTLASPIIGTTDLFLYAGRNITFNAGTDLILGGQFSTQSAGGNISVSDSGNIAIGGSLSSTTDVTANAANGGNTTFATGDSFSASDVVVETTVEPGVTLTDGANISFATGTSLTVNGGSLSLTINDSNGGTIGTGGNITLNTGANLTVNGGGALTLDVLNNDGGHIGTGGNISVTTGGDLTAGSIDALIDNRNGGTIDSSANLTFNIGGALTTTGDASFGISNSNDGSGGGMIGSDAVINVTAANISAGGALNAAIDNSSGGTIGGNATINLTAANITANSLLAQIDNSNGGSIGSGANVTLNVGGDLTTQGDATLWILNFDDGGGPGTIGVDAVINVAANNISIGGGLEAAVINFGGTITGNATVNVTAPNITTGGGFDSRILTNIGASIGGDAAINLTANTLSVGALSSTIESDDASINGSANINFNLTGDLTTQGDAGIAIENVGGTIGSNATVNVTANNISTGGNFSASIINLASGTIGLDAAVNVSAASISTVGTLNAEINNAFGTINESANVNFNLTGDLTTGGDAAFQIVNSSGGAGTIGSNATVNVTANNLSTGGNLGFTIENSLSGTIGGNATVNLTANNLSTGGNLGFTIANSFSSSNIGGNTTIDVTAASILANSLLAQIDTFHSSIGSGANVTLNVGGDLTTVGDATLLIRGGGGIGSDAMINVAAANVSTGTLNAAIDNVSGGTIGGTAKIKFNLAGDLTTGGDAAFQIANSSGGVGTMIGSHAVIDVTANNVSTGTLNTAIDNSSGGTIGGVANLLFELNGDLATTSGDASFRIDNANRTGFGGSSINGVAIIDIGLGGNISAQGAGLFDISNDDGGFGHGAGTIGSNAIIIVGAANISTGGALVADIFNLNGGAIDGNATVNVTANNISAGGGRFSASILNNGGNIGLDAAVNVSAASISTTNELVTNILNLGGTIGGNATIIDMTAANINTQALEVEIFNPGGSIGSGANVTLNVGGDLTVQSGSGLAGGINNNGGTIGGNATFNVTAANITAPSLLAQIDNTGGSINGNAVINMNVSGSATVTNATVAIFGNDPAGSAEININGSYDVGGTFLSRIDGNGTLTFNNASAHADFLKAGVFGTNGVLNVGGGVLSADTTLKLYAAGSNGQLNFVSNVTLSGNSAKILAANSVTIFNNIVVTIGGPNPADVFTNNANYTGFGGNGTTTGTFAGTGANNPQPLINAPPFGASPIATRTRIPLPPSSPVATGGKVPVGSTVTTGKKIDNAINVSSSDELLSLLDGAVPGPGGKITIPASKITNNSRHSSRVDPAGRLNPVSRLNADRRATDMRTASSSLMRRSPQ